MKIIFFGSDDFALVNLEKLLAAPGHEIVACVTQPDKPKGRGLKVTASPIKECALEKKLPLFQPDKITDPAFISSLKEFQCDLFVVVAYGKILPPEVLAIPYVCAMNVHASLLPNYRGAAPINWAIVNGDEETGVSIIKMNSQMDAGDIFSQAKCRIGPQDTAVTLRRTLAELGAQLLVKTINTLEKNEYTLTAQDRRKVTLAPKLSRELGKIDWTISAQDIYNQVRGLLPWPGAFSVCQGKQVKVLDADVLADLASGAPPGEVVEIRPNGVVIAAGEGSLLVKKVHPESGKEMPASDLVSGYRITTGTRFS